MKTVLFSLVIFTSLSCLAESFICKDSSQFGNGIEIQLKMDDLDFPGATVTNKSGHVVYSEDKAFELRSSEDSKFSYNSYNIEFLIALGYDKEDYDPVFVRFDIDTKKLTITPYLGGEDVGTLTYNCTSL